MTTDLTHARDLDIKDPLAPMRARFHLPEKLIYLDGNSLGPLPIATVARQKDMVARQWGEGLIRSWNDADWIDAPARIGRKIARLIGAKPHEVLVTDSVSVNIFKLLVASAQLSPKRPQILSEAGNFHTDLHIASGAAEVMPHLRLDVLERTDLLDAFGPETNTALLTHVHYKTAERFDMAAVTARATDAGARIVWDLSHSVGAVPLHLNQAGAELAVGCGYKYLNGGPGAPAFLYVAEHLQERLVSPLRGWFGPSRSKMAMSLPRHRALAGGHAAHAVHGRAGKRRGEFRRDRYGQRLGKIGHAVRSVPPAVGEILPSADMRIALGAGRARQPYQLPFRPCVRTVSGTDRSRGHRGFSRTGHHPLRPDAAISEP